MRVPRERLRHSPLIIFATVAFGNDRSSSVDPDATCPSRSDMVVRRVGVDMLLNFKLPFRRFRSPNYCH